MKALLFLLLVLAAISNACSPSLNDFYYLGNETHSTADLIRDPANQYPPGTAWSEIVSQVYILFDCGATPNVLQLMYFAEPQTAHHMAIRIYPLLLSNARSA